jgi:hypothetical protein
MAILVKAEGQTFGGPTGSRNARTIDIQEKDRVRNKAGKRIYNYKIDRMERKHNICRGRSGSEAGKCITVCVVYAIGDVRYSFVDKKLS